MRFDKGNLDGRRRGREGFKDLSLVLALRETNFSSHCLNDASEALLGGDSDIVNLLRSCLDLKRKYNEK